MTTLDLVAIALAALALLGIAVAAAAGRRRLAQLVLVEPAPLDEPLLVVIPARNEAANLRSHLPVVAADPAELLRIVVVDDCSTDETALVAEELARNDRRVSLLRLGDEPGPGVFGKPRALAAAVDDARARGALPALALFLDADMMVQPGLLGGLVTSLRREHAHALSGVPRLELRTPSEALFLPTLVALLTAHVRAERVHAAGAPDAFLNGQVLLVDTAALAQVGGWAAVAGTVQEDVALARRLKAAGLTLRLGDLRALVSTRMYASYREMVRGFGKNATAMLGRRAGIHGVLGFALALTPWAALALAAHRGNGATIALVATLFVVTLLLQANTRRDAGVPIWPVLALPWSYLGAALILLRAGAAELRGAPIEWRGRRYPR